MIRIIKELVAAKADTAVDLAKKIWSYAELAYEETQSAAALIEALENGRLAGAGLDVTDPEPVAPDSPLFKLPNVIVTPHYAPTTVESATRVSKIAAENINAVLAGKEPVGRIV